MFTTKTLKIFIKDYSLPIQVIQEPYFSYFIDLYDNNFQSKAKLKLLKDTINLIGSEEEFLNLRYEISDNIIKTIKDTAAYKELVAADMDRFMVPNKGYPTKDVFKLENVGKCFLSIDFKKANFQALKHFFPGVVLNCNSYQDLIELFTNLDYFKNSKHLRQIIFGNLNPKRQARIQRFIIQQILDWAIGEEICEEKDVRMVSNDEVVFELKDLANCFVFTEPLENEIKSKLGYNVRVDSYQLSNIGNTKFFVKSFINKSGHEIMCVPLVYFAQAYKKINNLELEEWDLCFMYEKQVCRFIEPLNFGEVDMKENIA